MNAFSFILDEPETVLATAIADAWHCDPKDKNPQDEDARQALFLSRAKILCPGVDVFAVPNAGKRSQWERMKRTREGMKPGVLDLVCTWRGGCAFLEFKDGVEMPTPNQRDRLQLYIRQGHHCGVFRTADSAIAFLRAAGAPFIDRPGL